MFIDNIHNYADDSTITSYSNSKNNLIKSLEYETSKALAWLDNNKMIVNPDKFQCIICTKDKADNTGLECKIGNKTIKTEASVKLLGIKIDNKLNFEDHVRAVCRKASAQLNALFRIKHILSPESKQVLINSFVMANFNYCPVVWHFTSANASHKIEMIQKRALRFLLTGY